MPLGNQFWSHHIYLIRLAARQQELQQQEEQREARHENREDEGVQVDNLEEASEPSTEDLEDIEQYGGILNEAKENRPLDPRYVGGAVLQHLFLTRRRLEYDPLGIVKNIPRQPVIPRSSSSSSAG
ncbi:hypothetical protein L7F22_035664 [Adiantum nelumboides]|nr:hypothetical protein [Adiantum nelumboides]